MAFDERVMQVNPSAGAAADASTLVNVPRLAQPIVRRCLKTVQCWRTTSFVNRGVTNAPFTKVSNSPMTINGSSSNKFAIHQSA